MRRGRSLSSRAIASRSGIYTKPLKPDAVTTLPGPRFHCGAQGDQGDLVVTMRRFKVGAVTVIDADRRPVGVVSQDDLLLVCLTLL